MGHGLAMLEQRQLLLGPWAPFPQLPAPIGGTASRRRAVSDPDTRAPLGQVAWHADEVAAWLAWLARPRYEVFETEDVSLLFTVQRVRGPWSYWKIADADDRLVGYWWHQGMPFPTVGIGPIVQVTHLADASGHVFAELRPLPSGPSGRFCLEDGEELGTLAQTTEGLLLSFAPRSTGNPFVRMLLLAAVLPLELRA
jgi:hypothetical protein